MDAVGCNRVIFSSSARVCGIPQYLPVDEGHPVSPVNVYGRTKAMVKYIIRDGAAVEPLRSAAKLRYFNPVVSYRSGEFGEGPAGMPSNLIPCVADVACKVRPVLSVFGADYNTPDETGVRDNIHGDDLAEGHLAAMDYLEDTFGVDVFNIGTGQGYLVMGMIRSFEKVSDQTIPYEIVTRRNGDVATSFANPRKTEQHWLEGQTVSG